MKFLLFVCLALMVLTLLDKMIGSIRLVKVWCLELADNLLEFVSIPRPTAVR